MLLQGSELIALSQHRLALMYFLEREQDSNMRVKGGVTPGGPIISTNDKQHLIPRQCRKIASVTPYTSCQFEKRWPIYLLIVGFLMFTALEWVVGFFLLKFWFFEMFAMFGTMFFLMTWFSFSLLFVQKDKIDSGIDVQMGDGENYRITGGHFLYGILGVTVSTHRCDTF